VLSEGIFSDFPCLPSVDPGGTVVFLRQQHQVQLKQLAVDQLDEQHVTDGDQNDDGLGAPTAKREQQ